MQRAFLLLFTCLALYVSGSARATDEAPAGDRPAPHIALLLPLKSAAFGTAADAVRLGFLAASQAEPGLPVRVYGCFDEAGEAVALYRRALADGAVAVVGPLTRSGVAALAAETDIPVPTLTLNSADGETARLLYSFGMAIETEARQVAQLARQDGFRRAVVIITGGALSGRLQQAFEEQWQALGAELLPAVRFNGDVAVLDAFAALPDTAVFLATDAEKARLMRPYLPNKLPLYATSQVFTGNENTLVNYDLNGVRFVDMPWLLRPDHPAVMIYPRPVPPLPPDRERLYALGIDAFRLIRLLLDDRLAVLPLDGVSGDIRLEGHAFQRMPITAVFTQGYAQSGNARIEPVPRMFPDQPIEQP